MTELPAAFYVADGDGWQSTVITTGPWDAGFQHAGPPAALIGRAIEGLIHDTDLRVARISFNLRRPVPVALLRIEAELQPGGRRVRYARARLLDSEGRLLIEAEALLMRSAPVTMPARPAALPAPPPPPSQCEAFQFPFFITEQGYHTGMELRLAEGEFGSGQATAWFRMRRPLIAGEEPSALQRVLIAADSGNGVSKYLDTLQIGFMNPDLIVALHRVPEGEWLALRAQTLPGLDGVGVAESVICDLQGVVGHGQQTLMFEPHGE